jgi:hypothetical protein
MDFSLRSILNLARFSLQSPRAAAGTLLAMQLPGNARWTLFFLGVISSALASHIGFRFLPPEAQALWANAMSRPIQGAVMQIAFWLLAVIGLQALGRWGGRQGSFADTLLLVGWWQLLFFCLEAAQILALLIIPPLGELIGLVGLIVLLWVLTQFVIELHGFHYFWRVFPGVIATLVLAAVALIVVLAAVVIIFTGGA